MLSLTENAIRASFLNASQRERKAIPMPDLDAVAWDDLDYLGWRDTKLTHVGYVVVPGDDGAVGILLREAEQRTRTRPQCAWCEDVTLPNDVVFFSARRAGAAGRNGNTIGTLVCEWFECSANVRKLPPLAYLGYDIEAARQRRIEALRVNVRRFADDLRSTI